MEFIKDHHLFIAKTFQGLEGVLAEELEELGAEDVKTQSRAVRFYGNKELLYKVNMHSQLALRFLVSLDEGEATSEKELYDLAFDFPWENYFTEKETFAIDSIVKSKYFNHTKYTALKVKDAIADRFRSKVGVRPSVKPIEPDYRINVHIWENQVKFYLDSSCEPLFKRGYKIQTHNAPMNEVLAAGMIRLAGWNKKDPFYDPMTGSGTIIAEALMMATKTPPGKFRKYYGFRNWTNYQHSVWKKVIAEAEGAIQKPEGEFYSSDVSRKNLSIAKQNLENAGLIDYVDFSVRAFEKTKKPANSGMMILNPPYGERMERSDISELYEKIGHTFKAQYEDWDAWVISSSLEGMEAIGLKTNKRHTLYNGSLECRYNGYALYAGSKREEELKPEKEVKESIFKRVTKKDEI